MYDRQRNRAMSVLGVDHLSDDELQEQLDEAVQQSLSSLASSINNRGVEFQLEVLEDGAELVSPADLNLLLRYKMLKAAEALEGCYDLILDGEKISSSETAGNLRYLEQQAFGVCKAFALDFENPTSAERAKGIHSVWANRAADRVLVLVKRS